MYTVDVLQVGPCVTHVPQFKELQRKEDNWLAKKQYLHIRVKDDMATGGEDGVMEEHINWERTKFSSISTTYILLRNHKYILCD